MGDYIIQNKHIHVIRIIIKTVLLTLVFANYSDLMIRLTATSLLWGTEIFELFALKYFYYHPEKTSTVLAVLSSMYVAVIIAMLYTLQLPYSHMMVWIPLVSLIPAMYGSNKVTFFVIVISAMIAYTFEPSVTVFWIVLCLLVCVYAISMLTSLKRGYQLHNNMLRQTYESASLSNATIQGRIQELSEQLHEKLQALSLLSTKESLEPSLTNDIEMEEIITEVKELRNEILDTTDTLEKNARFS